MIKLKDGVAAVRDALKGGVSPSVPTNTHVELASQSEPEPQRKADEYDGEMPKSNAFVSDRSRVLKEIAERRDAQAVSEGNESVPATDENGNEVEGHQVTTGTDENFSRAAPRSRPAGTP